MQRINCDVFVKDGHIFNLEAPLCITGNFYVGDNCTIFADIDTEGDIILGDSSYVETVSAGGNVFIGDFSEVINIEAKKGISLGCYSHAERIVTPKEVSLGFHSTANIIISETGTTKGKSFNLRTILKKMLLELKY